jgi:hypothetical protein
MNKFSVTLLSILFCTIHLWAQPIDSFISYDLQIISADSIQQLNLVHAFSYEETVSGYFYIEKNTNLLGGKYQKGGFDFLDSKLLDFSAKLSFQDPTASKDLDDFLTGTPLEKICTFQIIPNIADEYKDTISAILKYALYSRKSSPDSKGHLSTAFDISLHAGIIKIVNNKSTTISFLQELFPTHAISLKIQKGQNPSFIRSDVSPVLLQSISEFAQSNWQKDLRFDISAEFIKTADVGHINNGFPPRLYTRIARQSMQYYSGIFDEQKGTAHPIGSGIYSTDMDFPFHLLNTEKEQLYKGYHAYADIARSRLVILLVPESISMDSLYATVYIGYRKINVDDIQRWTPIKKHVVLMKDAPTYISLPKENWNAVFTRSNEKYEIYGYSDFEKHVNEYICLTLNTVSK